MDNQLLILALDQGTSSSKASLFNTRGEIIACSNKSLAIEYPADGWVQQDPKKIWNSMCEAMSNLEKKIGQDMRKMVISCGITNQRETTILWKRSNGEACGPALVWQDCRTADICNRWKNEGLEKEWSDKTGLILDPYFSASKIHWLLKNESSAVDALAIKDLCFGTVETWLLWNLTGGKSYYSDMSNASRTLLMDLENRIWMEKFTEITNFPYDLLPKLVPCRGDFGVIASNLPFAGVKVEALLGDQQAATFGQHCLKKGEAKCTYGTGAFLVINTESQIYKSSSGLLSTLGWTNEKGDPVYCLEGSIFNAGTVIQWLRDGLGIIKKAEEINDLAQKVSSSEGVMLVPAFTGLGAPYWDPKARGVLLGLTRDTKKEHIARASLEGIALSVSTLIDIAEETLNDSLKELAVDGGAAASNPLLQAQSDFCGLTVRRPMNLESTSRGVAILAGLQSKVIPNLHTLTVNRKQNEKLFVPKITAKKRDLWKKKWTKAINRSLDWY